MTTRWVTRRLTPMFPPIGPDGFTYNPRTPVETCRMASGVAGSIELLRDVVWRQAPLTKIGRSEVPPLLQAGWRVRHRGGDRHCALVLRLGRRSLFGAIISAAPERVSLPWKDRVLVVTPERVVAIRGTDERTGFRVLGDLLLGTRPVRRRRKLDGPPIPEEDLDALGALVP